MIGSSSFRAMAEPKIDDVQTQIAAKCDELKAMLLAKNRDYGNSALDPVRVFSKLPARELILIRMDDKLSRIRGLGTEAKAGEDALLDLLGYGILLRVLDERERARTSSEPAERPWDFPEQEVAAAKNREREERERRRSMSAEVDKT